MKTYQITLSKVFPIKHPKRGLPTAFRELYESGIKIHTIRANFPYWKGRFDNIAENEGFLSLRQWSEKPYYSKHEPIRDLYASDGIGLQELVFVDGDIMKPCIVQDPDLFNPERQLIPIAVDELAANDGLSVQDWLDWFKVYDLTEPMAIIHFTRFRYNEHETNS